MTNNGYFTWRPIHIFYVAQFFLEWEMFQTKVVEKVKTHILWSIYIYIYIKENRLIYEIIWYKIVEPDRPQMTIRSMHITCWFPNATN